MKSLIISALAGMTVAASLLTAQQNESPLSPIVVCRASGKLTIDGNLEDWPKQLV